MTCETCATALDGNRCPSCEIYNAAVTAQNAAAQEIARNFDPDARDAWLNEHGIFAWVHGVTTQVGTPYEAEPFIKMVRSARGVITFQPRPKKRTRTNAARTR